MNEVVIYASSGDDLLQVSKNESSTTDEPVKNRIAALMGHALRGVQCDLFFSGSLVKSGVYELERGVVGMDVLLNAGVNCGRGGVGVVGMYPLVFEVAEGECEHHVRNRCRIEVMRV